MVNSKNKKIILSIILITFLVIFLVVFKIYENKIFTYTATNFGICPENSVLVDMSTIEEIVPVSKEKEVPKSTEDAILIGYGTNIDSYFLSKCRIKYMEVKTIENLRGGVLNYCEPLVSLREKIETGFLYKYRLAKVLNTRKYTKEFRVKLNEYVSRYDEKRYVIPHQKNNTLIKF